MKVSELTGAALDWAVAKCEDEEVSLVRGQLETRWTDNGWKPSTDWALGGPIIERERISAGTNEDDWCADITSGETGFIRGFGPTPLIAAMRCFVASKLGADIEVPKELTGE